MNIPGGNLSGIAYTAHADRHRLSVRRTVAELAIIAITPALDRAVVQAGTGKVFPHRNLGGGANATYIDHGRLGACGAVTELTIGVLTPARDLPRSLSYTSVIWSNRKVSSVVYT